MYRFIQINNKLGTILEEARLNNRNFTRMEGIMAARDKKRMRENNYWVQNNHRGRVKDRILRGEYNHVDFEGIFL